MNERVCVSALISVEKTDQIRERHMIQVPPETKQVRGTECSICQINSGAGPGSTLATDTAEHTVKYLKKRDLILSVI